MLSVSVNVVKLKIVISETITVISFFGKILEYYAILSLHCVWFHSVNAIENYLSMSSKLLKIDWSKINQTKVD
jgi:hypothetical protein